MLEFLSSKNIDNVIMYSFLIFLILSFTIDVTKLIKNIFDTKSKNNNINTKILIFALIILFIIPISICLMFYNYIKSLQYFNLIISFIMIIFTIIFLYKGINTINKTSLKKETFEKHEKYSIVFSQLLYFVFFSSSIYNFFIETFNNINNNFISDLLITTYITIKVILALFFAITNLLFILKILHENIGKKIHIWLNTIYKNVNGYELKIDFTSDQINISFEQNETKKHIKFFYSKINQLHIIFKLPIILIIFYLIEFIKIILLTFLNIFIFPIKYLEKIFNKETLFFYKFFRIIICFSISATYFYILFSDNFNDNSIKFFEFLGISIIITSFLSQLYELKNKEVT